MPNTNNQTQSTLNIWQNWRRRLLQLTCLLIGTVMFYRGPLNLFGYPDNAERLWLAPIFFGGVFGIVLMWRELKVGWWVFTLVNILVGIWFICGLEDIWQHHVAPHILFSAVFLPFYPGMRQSTWLKSAIGRVRSATVSFLLQLLQKPWAGRLVHSIPALHGFVNKMVINGAVNVTRHRPHPFSTMAPYTSWASLTDKTWSGRQLGFETEEKQFPEPAALAAVFARPAGTQRLSDKSTCLFPAFAQYLTDGFMRTDPEKDPETGIEDENRRKRNTSTHNIDMCTLYGLNRAQTLALRVREPSHNQRGLLRSQDIAGEEYPPFLFKNGQINPDFDALNKPLGLKNVTDACASNDPATAAWGITARDALFAVGGDRVNSVPQVSMINTLWLREHNRLARALGDRYPDWDDDRVFETARNIVIVEFIKVVVEEYINHITPLAMDLMADPTIAWEAPWNRPVWITTEFSLLYRWHSLIPDRIVWGNQDLPVAPPYFLNNQPLLDVGLRRAIEDMSAQPAGELGPRNTSMHLLGIEIDSIRQGRICELKSYNAYRRSLGRKPVKTFDEISSDPAVARMLSDLYSGNVDDVEFFVGIFCEDVIGNSPLPSTILALVAMDAFSQALTNPLLSKFIFPKSEGEDHPTFTDYGWGEIGSCNSIHDLVVRNTAATEGVGFIGMTQQNWRPK